jgi:hypothetical protein
MQEFAFCSSRIARWFGDDFDPQPFSVDNINRMLSPERRHGKTCTNT